MTSSLVGSEMCIRDSSRTKSKCRSASHHECKPAETVNSRCEIRGEPYAVSYTHLTLPTICSV
eukprot:5322642-Prorocentrum_lima.AAC.1